AVVPASTVKTALAYTYPIHPYHSVYAHPHSVVIY
uniref:Cuticle protein 9 n=1 Tax=Blaberus craniifer TaxID=6982 RepID=CUO9_BLACR|nr:RecName: Full=Cuticle protein 9; AltName: Full=BcNCP3.8 [Blaberus craniifer]